MIREFELGNEGFAYLRRALTSGNTLMRELLQLPLENGRVTALLPAALNAEKLIEFEHGGVATGEVQHIREGIAKLISTSFSDTAYSLAVFEDYMREPESKLLAGEQYFVYRTEVNLYLDSRSANSIDRVRHTMKKASQYTSRAILTSFDGGRQVSNGEKITLEFLRAIARNARYIFVGAYDEESCVIWTRGNN